MRMSLKEDRVLIREFIHDDNERSLERLIHRHKEKVFTSIYMFTRDRYLAEDLFQDTFIKVVDKLKRGKYKEEGKFLPWVMRIARNMCIDYYRKSKRKKIISTSEDFDIFDVLPLEEKSAEDHLILEQAKDKVRQLLDELSPEQPRLCIGEP